MHNIIIAQTAQDFVELSGLVREYVVWCKARYCDDAWFIDQAFSH
jgi:hypothetical protein